MYKTQAIHGILALTVLLLAGCVDDRRMVVTEDTRPSVVTLERNDGTEYGFELEIALQSTSVVHQRQGGGSSRTIFPGETRFPTKEIDGKKWHGFRSEGIDVKRGEYIEVLARYDTTRNVYLVRMDSTMPFILRAKFDTAADAETVEVACDAGKRAFEVGAVRGK